MSESLIGGLFGQIAQYGLLGAMFLIVMYSLYRRDKELTEERQARLADAKSMTALVESATASRVISNELQQEHNQLVTTVIKHQEDLAKIAADLANRAMIHDSEQYMKLVSEVHLAVKEIREEIMRAKSS